MASAGRAIAVAMRTIVAFGIAMAVLMAVGVIGVEVLHEHPVKDLFQRPVEQTRDPRLSEALRGIPMTIAAPRGSAAEV